MAAAASPAVANQIGQYFKGLAADNENGQLSAGQETAHVLAHGILAAAVASAGGNDATTAGSEAAAAGSEAAAPVLAKWLYDKDSSDDLTAAEKQTLTSIMGAASTTVGATTGNVNSAIAAGQAGQNAVENNFLGPQSLEALKKAREKLTVENANKVVGLDKANQQSDQLLKQHKEDPESLSKSEKEKLGQYINAYYSEQVAEYGVEVAEKLTQNLFSDSPTISDSALGYNFPYALDSATKTAAADKIREANNPSVLEYLTGFRDKGENELTYQKAVGILRVNAVNESNAEVGDTILLASGVGEIAAAAKAAPAFLKGLFGTTEDVAKVAVQKVNTVQANKAAGDAVRDVIAARTGGVVEQNFRVTGGLRRVDVLAGTTAIESKVGKTSLTSRVKQELARDVKLLRSGQVDRVQWEFSPSDVTGKSGPTAPLRQKLEKFGIDIVE